MVPDGELNAINLKEDTLILSRESEFLLGNGKWSGMGHITHFYDFSLCNGLYGRLIYIDDRWKINMEHSSQQTAAAQQL